MTEARSKLYEAVDVWKRISEKHLVRYRCFRILPEGKYCVQSADHYQLPFPSKIEKQHEKQFLELLSEEAPDIRDGTCFTLEEAIANFEEGFEADFGAMEDFLERVREEGQATRKRR